MILVCPAISFGQTTGWEAQRMREIAMRQEGHVQEAFEVARKILADSERHESGSAPLALALHDYSVIAADLTMYADAERAIRRAIRLEQEAPSPERSVLEVFQL